MTPERLPTSKRRATDRRNPRDGRIARLPVSIRTQVNEKLRDNVRGPEIMEWLKKTYPGEYKKAGFGNRALKSLNAWRHGGYREWERRQQRLEEMKVQRELAFEIALQSDGTILAANPALAASHICDALQSFDIENLRTKLREKPELYPILIDGISKLSRASVEERKLQLELTKYQDRVAEQKRKIEAELGKAKEGGLSPENIARIEEALNLL